MKSTWTTAITLTRIGIKLALADCILPKSTLGPLIPGTPEPDM
jgi:hypothetical protein